MEKAEAKRRLYNINNYSSKNDLTSFETNQMKSMTATSSNFNSTSNNNNNNNANSNGNNLASKKYKSKEKRKIELVTTLFEPLNQ